MKKTVGIFCFDGSLAKFIKPVAEGLGKDFEVIECYSTDNETIQQTLLRSDIIWIEWANELAAHITKQHKNLLIDKRVIVRLHSYEAIFNNGQLLSGINWNIVSDLICVADHVLEVVKEKLNIRLDNVNCHVIPNGVDLKKFTPRKKEFNHKLINFGFAAHLDHKKEIPLLIQVINYFRLCNNNTDFKLHIAGNWGDERYQRYVNHITKELELSGNIIFYDWVEDTNEWLENIDFIVNSSPWESQGMIIMEAMAKGIIPLVHNFPGAKDIYPNECVWNGIDEFEIRLKCFIESYKQCDFREWVVRKYNFEDTQDSLFFLLTEPFRKRIIEDPLVGCVIAVRNSEKTIEETLRSLDSQTCPLQQLVIVDDKSTDNTVNIINGFVGSINENIKNIKLIELKENVWVSKARNIGAKEITTDYIFFMDGDDRIDKTYVEKCVNVLQEKLEYDIVYTDSIYNDNEKEWPVNQPDFDPNLLWQHNYMHYASMQRTKVFNSLGGYSDLLSDYRCGMYDQQLWLKYIKEGRKAYHLKEGLFLYSDVIDGSITRSYTRSRTDQHYQILSMSTDQSIELNNNNRKKIMLVCFGKDYINRELVSWEVYTFTKALEEFGDVFSFYWDVESEYYGSDKMNDRLIEQADRLQPDLIFHVCYKDIVKKETWNKLSQKYNTVGFFCDDDWRYEDYSQHYNKGFNYIITTYKDAYEKYVFKRNRENTFLSQWACNSHYWESTNEDRPINSIFFGQNYGSRLNQLKDITWYGKGSPNGMVDFPEMCKLASQSKIAINFANSSRGEQYKQIKCRSFEVTGAGCLLLTEYSPRLEQYFECHKRWHNISYFDDNYSGEEIVIFQGIDDLSKKIKYLLKNNEIIDEVAKRGQERTLKDHTWKNRFEPIFNNIWDK